MGSLFSPASTMPVSLDRLTSLSADLLMREKPVKIEKSANAEKRMTLSVKSMFS
jgi:hypothetical protein